MEKNNYCKLNKFTPLGSLVIQVLLRCRDVVHVDQVAQWRKTIFFLMELPHRVISKSPCPITVKLKFEVSQMNW